MKIAIVGNNDGPLRLLRSLRKANLRAVCVGLQKPVPSPLQQAYAEHGAASDFFMGFAEEELIARLAPFSPDLLINCFCNFKFSALLEHYETLNIHLAPLPRYRGRHPLPWALINGESEFGVAIHRMTPAIDAGDIYWQKQVPVALGTSVQELREGLMQQVEANFGQFVHDYQQQTLTPLPNREEEATYVARRYPEDSRLTEWHDRDRVYRKVMALRSEQNPAYLRVNNQTVVVTHAALSDRRYVGVARPFVSRLLPDGVEAVCETGQTIQLLGFDPRHHQLLINQRLA